MASDLLWGVRHVQASIRRARGSPRLSPAALATCAPSTNAVFWSLVPRCQVPHSGVDCTRLAQPPLPVPSQRTKPIPGVCTLEFFRVSQWVWRDKGQGTRGCLHSQSPWTVPRSGRTDLDDMTAFWKSPGMCWRERGRRVLLTGRGCSSQAGSVLWL